MTVQELIDELMKVEDKSKRILMQDNFSAHCSLDSIKEEFDYILFIFLLTYL